MKKTRHHQYMGSMFQYLRLWYGLSQHEMAEILDVNTSTIWRIEKRQFGISDKMEQKLRAHYGPQCTKKALMSVPPPPNFIMEEYKRLGKT